MRKWARYMGAAVLVWWIHGVADVKGVLIIVLTLLFFVLIRQEEDRDNQ